MSKIVQLTMNGENNTYIYNYYDDWVSPDADSDQIVDVSYAIDGGAGNEDPYPLADPDAVPPVTGGTTTSGTGVGEEIPMELLMIGGGAVVVILIVCLYKKKGT